MLIYFLVGKFSSFFIRKTNLVSVIYNKSLLYLFVPFSGQITQWNLIFYGTNDPPQNSDPPRLGPKKTVNDVVHNSLENSQWGFITQDVSILAVLPFISSCFHNWLSRRLMVIHNHETNSFVYDFFPSICTGDRCRLSLRRSTNCRWRPHDQLCMF